MLAGAVLYEHMSIDALQFFLRASPNVKKESMPYNCKPHSQREPWLPAQQSS